MTLTRTKERKKIMLVKYDYSKEGIIDSAKALERMCDANFIESLETMYEMDGDMLLSDYRELINLLGTLRLIKSSLKKGGEVIGDDNN